MEQPNYLIFPIVNEKGFKVNNPNAYAHMIKTIVEAQVELAEDYPDSKILVVYGV